MGACFSGGQSALVENNDGGEEAYHSRFLEDKVLGEGQFGVVKLVTDMKANNGEGEAMACKTLRKGVVFKDNTLYAPLKSEILQGEVEILRTLAGGHYCLKLTGVYESPRIIYVVTELCSGGEMMEYVSKQENLRTEDVSRISFQLLSAVDHCAKNRIIHRDIKPENTMFKDTAPGAELRLIDFGSGCIDKVARLDTDEGRHTTFAGSAFYISPEMFQKTYTSKTDVWSAGATLYVLAAGYPAEKLQKAFNTLQKAKGRDLRSLPGMPEEMPDSYIEMLDKLMCYRHKVRKSAGEMLQHEFVQFRLQQEETGLSIDDIAAVAAAVGPEPGDDENTTGRRGRPLQSIHLRESVRRHTAFLNYQQFERSVTTLLAALLLKPDLVALIQKVDAADSKDVGGASDENNPSKLKVIPISKLREILKEMKQDQALANMDKLPSAPLYNNFAYHIELLKQFLVDPDAQGKSMRLSSKGFKRSNSTHGTPNSVHGSSVFASFRKEKGRRSSEVALKRNNSTNSF